MLTVISSADAVVRLSPNESVFVAPADLAPHLGELVQRIAEVEPRLNVSVELDLGGRARDGEVRAGGATPLEAIGLAVVLTAADAVARIASRQLERLADRCFDVVVEWVLRHRGKSVEEVAVTLYGPNGEVLREVLVDRALEKTTPRH
jgi:hypothetical protein